MAAPAVVGVANDRDILRGLLLQFGVPVVEGAETARDFAIGLLKLAAEVEHALMVQYLYAATSLSTDQAPGAINYYEKLLDVAIQEMGHLATVQNLLLLLGGRDAMHMQRDVTRMLSEKNPIPFVLEPVNKTSLAKYVAAEKPARVPAELETKVNELVRLAEEDAGVDLRRVGVIYALLKWMFTPPAEAGSGIDFAAYAPLPENPHLTAEDLLDSSEVARYEAVREEWGADEGEVLLMTVHTVREAREAIHAIAEQGEGLEQGVDSHFTEFMEMVADFEANKITVLPLAKSPTLGAHGGEGGTVISHPYTRLWGEVFSLQYSLLVLTIYHALVTARPADGSEGLRGALASLAMRGMRRVIGPISDVCGSLRLSGGGSAASAGPPYDLDPSILQSNQPDELVAFHLRMADRLEHVYVAIERSEEFPLHPEHRNHLRNLRGYDKRRRDLFPPPAPPNGG